MREPLRLLAVAATFLTRAPLPTVERRSGDLRRAAGLFPLVGLAVAGAGVAVRAALAPWWGGPVAAVAAILAMIAATGALHEDGLADSADGLWGGWDPQGRLAIMRDSRVGTYGVVALVGVLSLRIALLAPLPLGTFARAAACGHVLGRAAMVLLARVLPAAAPGSGAEIAWGPAAPPVPPRLPAGTAARVVGAAVVVATLLLAAGWWAPLPLAVALAVTGGCARLLRRRLGGFTGDALGATDQVVELAVAATVVALARAGHL